jgi:hypothetical protein
MTVAVNLCRHQHCFPEGQQHVRKKKHKCCTQVLLCYKELSICTYMPGQTTATAPCTSVSSSSTMRHQGCSSVALIIHSIDIIQRGQLQSV